MDFFINWQRELSCFFNAGLYIFIFDDTLLKNEKHPLCKLEKQQTIEGLLSHNKTYKTT